MLAARDVMLAAADGTIIAPDITLYPAGYGRTMHKKTRVGVVAPDYVWRARCHPLHAIGSLVVHAKFQRFIAGGAKEFGTGRVSTSRATVAGEIPTRAASTNHNTLPVCAASAVGG